MSFPRMCNSLYMYNITALEPVGILQGRLESHDFSHLSIPTGLSSKLLVPQMYMYESQLINYSFDSVPMRKLTMEKFSWLDF